MEMGQGASEEEGCQPLPIPWIDPGCQGHGTSPQLFFLQAAPPPSTSQQTFSMYCKCSMTESKGDKTLPSLLP